MSEPMFRVLIRFNGQVGHTMSRLEYETICDGTDTIKKINDMLFASYLTDDEYSLQLMNADTKWMCPVTGLIGEFDDLYYEKMLE